MDESSAPSTTAGTESTSNNIGLISTHLAKLKKTTDSMPESALRLFGFLPKKKSNKEEK